MMRLPWFIIFILSPGVAPAAGFEFLEAKGPVQVKKTGAAPRTARAGMPLATGDTLITGAGASARLRMADGSDVLIGASSQLRLDAAPTSQPGVLSLLVGRIRAKFSKSEDGSTKALVRTPGSIMGVRGTEFEGVYNPVSRATSVVTLEGTVALVKGGADDLSRGSARALTEAFDRAAADGSRGAAIGPGQFSAVSPSQGAPTLPVRIAPSQFEALKQSSAGEAPRPSAAAPTGPPAGSPIPPGVDARALAATVAEGAGTVSSAAGAAPPQGSYDKISGRMAPPAGGFVDLKTGTYVPPPPGSAFDPIAQVYVPPPALGSVNPATGEYRPPEGTILDPARGLVTAGTPPPSPPPGAAPQPGAAGLFAGTDPTRFGEADLMAAPPPPGASLASVQTSITAAGVALPPPATLAFSTVAGAGALAGPAGAKAGPVGFVGGLLAAAPPPGEGYYPGYEAGRPLYPVYNPFVCPPYCDPRFAPGFTANQGIPPGSSTVNFIIVQ